MPASEPWTPKRFDLEIPFDDLTASEAVAVQEFLKAVKANPATAGELLPADHIGTTYLPEHEDYQPGYEDLWCAQIPGTRYRCTYQVDPAERTVTCWTFQAR